MSILAILETIWRHKLAALPVILATLAGAAYVVALSEPTYEAKASFVFINPPAPPTPAQIEREPSLAGVKADNPFTRFPDQSVVVDVLARRVNSEEVRTELVRQGADKRYEVVPSRRFGSSVPILEVVGVGATPDSAMITLRLVGDRVEKELQALQTMEGVDPRFLIRALEVEASPKARARVSSKARSLVGILALGALATLTAVSLAEAIGTRRAARRERLGGEGGVPEGDARVQRKRKARKAERSDDSSSEARSDPAPEYATGSGDVVGLRGTD